MTSSQISESQLLRAIDDIKDAKAGPPGPAGVGISRVEQHAEDTCTFYFTDGSHKLINLPRGRDGETGGQGRAGERGAEGAPAAEASRDRMACLAAMEMMDCQERQ